MVVKMKKIYLVLTCTGTILSNIIKYYTHDEYTHVSIALDKELKYLYSFGRLNPYIAFLGGFVQEDIKGGTFKRFKKTKTIIYELEVTEEEYDKISNRINYISENRKKYKFNVFGLFLVGLHIKYRLKNSFYCAEFVKYVLQAGNGKYKELPRIIRPEDFKKIDNKKVVYQGLLSKY